MMPIFFSKKEDTEEQKGDGPRVMTEGGTQN